MRNESPHLRDCLESIQGQSFGNWELLAVDDHSQDQSLAILDSFACKDSRIRVLHNPGSGLVDALNYGISSSRFELIARMDADDLMTPKRLELQVAFLKKHPSCGLVASKVHHFPSSSGNARRGFELYAEWTNELVSWDDLWLNRFVDCTFAHPSVLFRRRIVSGCGAYRNGSFPEDFELWLRWMQAGVKMAKIDKHLLYWRDHQGRTSRNSDRYSKESFQRVKAEYLGYWLAQSKVSSGRRILVWGAGKVAGKFTKILLHAKIGVSGLVDPDPKKKGMRINGLAVDSIDSIPSPKKCFVLILAGARGVRAQIKQFLDERGFHNGQDYLALA